MRAQLPGQAGDPGGDPVRSPGQRARQAQAGPAGQEPPCGSEGRLGQQQVEGRSLVHQLSGVLCLCHAGSADVGDLFGGCHSEKAAAIASLRSVTHLPVSGWVIT